MPSHLSDDLPLMHFQPCSPLEFRKGSLLMNNVFAVIAALLLTLAERGKSFEMLIIGRLIIGVDSGKSLFYSPFTRLCANVTVKLMKVSLKTNTLAERLYSNFLYCVGTVP